MDKMVFPDGKMLQLLGGTESPRSPTGAPGPLLGLCPWTQFCSNKWFACTI